MEIKDSGERREFATGSVRDIAEGKGRCDLMPLDIVAYIVKDSSGTCGTILDYIDCFIWTGKPMYLYQAIKEYFYTAYDTDYDGVLDVAIHFEEGAKKYQERNWEKGIPLHCFIDSGVRHLLKDARGDNDEPHGRAFVWNMLCALWTLKNKEEMIDLPFKEKTNG